MLLFMSFIYKISWWYVSSTFTYLKTLLHVHILNVCVHACLYKIHGNRIITIIYGMTALYVPEPSLEVVYFFFGFRDKIFTRWGCQPHAQPPTWRTRRLYMWPPETRWPSCTPRHWVPILVTFYDMQELRWNCSYPLVTTQDNYQWKEKK
jgi:hypothetical protein